MLLARTRRATPLGITLTGRRWRHKALRVRRERRVLLALRVLLAPKGLLVLKALRGLQVRMGLTGLTVRLQPLLLARRLLLLTLELRALLTAVVLAPLRLISFCVTDLLVRLGRLVLRGQQVLKDHKAILELRGLQVRRVRQAPRVLRSDRRCWC